MEFKSKDQTKNITYNYAVGSGKKKNTIIPFQF